MKIFLFIFVASTLISASMFAKCTDKDKGYSVGYSGVKEYKNQDQVHFVAYARAFCSNNSYAALGAETIKNMDAFFAGCGDGAADFYNNKKQKVECK